MLRSYLRGCEGLGGTRCHLRIARPSHSLRIRTHTAEPIPFLIWHPGIEADEVRTFDEVAACEGSYGLMKEDEFINEFMSSTTE